MKLSEIIWETQKLGDLCDLITDGTHFTPKYVDSGIPFLSVKNLTNGRIDFADTKFVTEEEHKTLSKRCCPKINDLLYTKVGTTGIAKVIDTERDFNIFVSVALLKPRGDKIYNFYLEEYLNSSFGREQANALTKGTANRNLVIRDIAEIKIKFPKKLETQKQIASLFQLIESNIDGIERQEKNLKSLLKNLINGLVSNKPKFGNLLTSKNCKLSTIDDIAECDKKYPEHKKKVERFIGLEFIEAENFQLQGFGMVEDGTTFSKRFTTGDVLFGKRRAYLRKIAVADFDGICSGDILVIRSKAQMMLQGLLPFYISSDPFIQLAVSTSAGSLSPRTKWKDLAVLEVSIPDLKTQEKILNVLQQLVNTINQFKHQGTTLKNLKQKLLNEILG
jgi:type I restriction enzyme S subunit